jgi:hypothetical protein
MIIRMADLSELSYIAYSLYIILILAVKCEKQKIPRVCLQVTHRANDLITQSSKHTCIGFVGDSIMTSFVDALIA